jgi:hypothetical protein
MLSEVYNEGSLTAINCGVNKAERRINGWNKLNFKNNKIKCELWGLCGIIGEGFGSVWRMR